MSEITLMRSTLPLPQNPTARELLFGVLEGFTPADKRAWKKFWRRLIGMEAGELAKFALVLPRSTPYRRRHMMIEQAVFAAQERFVEFEVFRAWLKIGAGWVDWCAAPKGGVVPLPRSVSYRAADQAEFEQFHRQTMKFLRAPFAAAYLWPQQAPADQAAARMAALLARFDE